MPNWWDNIQNGLGQAYMPNYGSLDPNAQQQANQQAMMQLGAGLLANSTKRPGEALGRSLGGLQQAGTQAMQAQAMAETMNDRRDERNQKQRRLQALGQFMMAPGIQQGMPEGFAKLSQEDPELGYNIWSASRKGQDPTDDIREFEYARQQGFGGTFSDWMSEKGMKLNLPPTQGADKGYMWTQEGGNWRQVPIPGGAIESAKQASDEGTARTANVVLGKTKQALDILEQYPNATTGLTGKIAGLKSDSPAAALQNAIGTIQSNIGFAELKRMRAESPTGGALGNVTIGEIERLERVLGDLKTYQDPRILRENLIMVENLYQDMVNKIIQGGGDPSIIGAVGGFQSSNRGGKSDVLSDDALFQKYGVR